MTLISFSASLSLVFFSWHPFQKHIWYCVFKRKANTSLLQWVWPWAFELRMWSKPLYPPGLNTARIGTSDQPFGLGCVSIYLLETTDSSFFFFFIEDDTKSPQPTCHYLGFFMVAWSLLTRCTSLHGVGFLNIGACPKLQLT